MTQSGEWRVEELSGEEFQELGSVAGELPSCQDNTGEEGFSGYGSDYPDDDRFQPNLMDAEGRGGIA